MKKEKGKRKKEKGKRKKEKGKRKKEKGKRKKEKGKRKKGKEKANNIEDSVEGDSNNETSNHVQLDKHIMTTDFSNYTMSTKCPAGSYFTPQLVEDLAYSTHKTLGSSTAIINSSTSTHIHSNCNDFLSLNSSTSCNIKGFRRAKSHVTGCGTALITVQLPSGHKTHLKLTKACLVPNSSPILLSVSCLDQAKFYTLFGDRRCVSFPMDDGG